MKIETLQGFMKPNNKEIALALLAYIIEAQTQVSITRKQ